MQNAISDTGLTVQEVAEYLGCSISMVRKLVRTRKIPHYRVGTSLKFRQSSINNWIDLQEQKGDMYNEYKY